MAPQETITAADFQSKIGGDEVVVVKFGYQGCNACQKYDKTTVKILEKEFPTVPFLEVDVHDTENSTNEAARNMKRTVGVFDGFPTIHFFSNGKLLDTVRGGNAAAIRSKLQYLLQ